MRVTTEQRRSALFVRIDGELDLHTSPHFRERVMEAFDGSSRLQVLVVVLSDVVFIDSSGLGALLACYRNLTPRGVRIVLANPRPAVRKVLQLSGVLSRMDVVDSEAQAALRM